MKNEPPAEVNVKNNNGDTPISIASKKGHGDIVKLLLDNGADKKDINTTGKGPGDKRVEATAGPVDWRADAGLDRAGPAGDARVRDVDPAVVDEIFGGHDAAVGEDGPLRALPPPAELRALANRDDEDN